MSVSKTPIVCRHGCLRRSCETCVLADDCERLETDLAAARAGANSAIKLVTDMRFALGDNGKRMQPELIEYCRQLVADRAELVKALKDAMMDCDHMLLKGSSRTQDWAMDVTTMQSKLRSLLARIEAKT